MAVTLSLSSFQKVRDGIFRDDTGAYLITDVERVQAEHEGHIQQLHTREMKLDTLGVFPLAKEALPLLDEKPVLDGTPLVLAALLKKSQIPIFTDSSARMAYIPPAGASICRYFFDLWRRSEAQSEKDEDQVVGGFVVLMSYAGG
ncbi:MAG: hypothetical protein LDLANPLL_02800 [Turneriella sp.]|nr:hypothetical protein [Turneriella sp.]